MSAALQNLILIPLAALSLVLAASGAVAGKESTWDGSKWQAATADERDGFVAGYVDCTYFESKPESKELPGSRVEWAQDISKQYDSSKIDSRKQVARVFDEYWQRVGTQRQRSNDRHTYFDGEYWRQSSLPHRTAFIEAYAQCRSPLSRVIARVGATRATALISQWYGVKTEDPSEIDLKRSEVKIADVIAKIR